MISARNRRRVLGLVFFVIVQLRQSVVADHSLQIVLACPEQIGSDLPQGAQLIIGDVVFLVLGKDVEKDSARARAIGNDDAISCRTASSPPSDALLDDPAAQLGINKPTFSAPDFLP